MLFVDLAHDLLGHLVELLLFYRGKLRPPDHLIVIHLLELLQDGLSVLQLLADLLCVEEYLFVGTVKS